jgi:hypothetical protein
MDYVTLSLGEAALVLEEVALDADAVFAGLDATQLNWKPAPERWSVAQCLDHLVTSNDLMLRAADEARRDPHRTLWQRLPVLPGFFGRLLIRSLTPEATRKLTAPPAARPSASAIDRAILARYLDQQQKIAGHMRTLDEAEQSRAIMTSPFIRAVTYSVLDAYRILAAHNRRHVEQARRVVSAPGFPSRTKEA